MGRRTATGIVAVVALLGLPGAAHAVVTASADATAITITGEAGADATTLSSEGANIRVTNATAASGCSASGSDALCPAREKLAATLGDGDDLFELSATAAATVDAGPGNDSVTGGGAADELRGGVGDDSLSGGAGNDVVIGGPGTDTTDGGAGSDTISFGDDTSAATITLGQGEAGGTFENVVASPFNDTVVASDAGLNRLDGGAGADTVSYVNRAPSSVIDVDLAAGTMRIAGTVEDTLAAFENVTGSPGANKLRGTTGVNVIQGGAGDDELLGDLGGDLLIGGAGTDTVSFDYLAASFGAAGITHTIGGLAANNSEGDTSLEIEGLLGSKRDDVLLGNGGDNTFGGGDGNDRIAPGAGTDRSTGGAGTDTLDYAPSPVAIHARLSNIGGLRVTEFAATRTTDVMTDQFENVIGSAFADVLRGGSLANRLVGGSGNDVIDGDDGDDTLDGQGGNDRFGRVSGSIAITAQASAVPVGNADTDGSDTVLGGLGNDDINVRDQELDRRVDCGAGTDIARQDLPDDDGNLDVDNCETIETIAVDQRAMTRASRLTRRGGTLVVRLSCPARSRVACNGAAAVARTASGRRGRSTRYRIRRGRAMTVRVAGSRGWLVLTERDQRGRTRRLVTRIR